MVIKIADIVPGANTADEGAVVLECLRNAMRTEKSVVVSFDSIQTATSSFVNASFVELLSEFPFSEIKARVRVVRSTRQINDMVRTRLEKSAQVKA